MANFLKDIEIINVTLDFKKIKLFCDIFSELQENINRGIPVGQPLNAYLSFVLRHESQGDRFFNKNDLLEKYASVKKTERIIISLESPQSISSNRVSGPYAEIVFDTTRQNNFLTVTSDDPIWLENTFLRLVDAIKKCKNKNSLVRNNGTQLFVQIIGVAICFFLSIIAAKKIGPLILFENGFIISFLFSFLLSSNVWSYLQFLVLRGITLLFPNIRFIQDEKSYLHWSLQAIAGAMMLFSLNWVGEKAWSMSLELSRGMFNLQ